MKDLIHILSKGIPRTMYHTLRTRPDIAVRDLELLSTRIVEAAQLLAEARAIIMGLTSDNATFAHREAALNFTKREM